MISFRHVTILLGLALGLFWLASPSAALPRMQMVWRPWVSPAGPEWRVLVRITDLSRPGDQIGLELPRWGHWAPLKDDHVRLVWARPPVQPVQDRPGAWTWSLDSSASSKPREVSLRFVCRDPRHPTVGTHPLLPVVTEDFSLGYANNVLPFVTVNGQVLPLRRELTTLPPPGWKALTGWDIGQPPTKPICLGEAAEGGVLGTGARPIRRQTTSAGIELEVVGLGVPEAAVDQGLAHGAAFLRNFVAWTGLAPVPSVRVFLSAAGTLGVHTDHGIHVPVPTDLPRGAPWPRDTTRRLAHEMFHVWAGTALRTSPGLDWLREGLAQYAALRALVQTRRAPTSWLASELLGQWTAKPAALLSSGALLDTGSDWRSDPDRESQAYAIGVLMVFAWDVEMRSRASHLGRWIGHLVEATAGRVLEPKDLVAALSAPNRDRLELGAVPDLLPLLRSAGFLVRQRLVKLPAGAQGQTYSLDFLPKTLERFFADRVMSR